MKSKKLDSKIDKMSLQKSNFLLFFILSVFIFASCETQKADLSKMKIYDGPTLKAFNIELYYSDSAKLKVKMTAPLQLEYENGNQDFPKGIKVIFYDAEMKENTQITSNKAKYIKQENRYVAYSNVIVKNLKKNEQLNTEELNWTPINRKIYTDKFVTITTDDEILKGEGMTASQDFNTYQLKKPTGKFKVKK